MAKAAGRQPAERTPALAAIEQMAKLASAGAHPDRMRTSVAAILEQWMAEELGEGDMRERLEQLQADLDGGLETVENADADADTDGQKRAAAAQKAALTSARDAVGQALEKMGG